MQTRKRKASKITDYISGQQIKATPEEIQATQPFSQILVNDYKYKKLQISTRPQFHIKKSPSDNSGGYPVDIAVFKTSDKKDDELFIIVECKQHSVSNGISQLENYLAMSSAEFGVWYNGIDSPVYLRKSILPTGIDIRKVPNIPKNGTTFQSQDYLFKNDLIVPHNLIWLFTSLRSHLAGNAKGVTRDEEIARQLINVILVKIHDEKFTKPDVPLSFYAGINESPEKVAERIRSIFENVKTKYPSAFDAEEKMSLDDNSLYYIAGLLQNYSLLHSERDVVADAFETFIGPGLKGEQGQFFTPRNVVRMMVNILNQGTDERLIDPACGSGGFIVESLKRAWDLVDKESNECGWDIETRKQEKEAIASTLINGMEKDSFLAKVSKAYMAILGNGKSGIFCEDSLDLPRNWSNTTQKMVSLGSYSCLLANPPFGKDIKINGEEKLRQYKLAHKWKRNADGDFAMMDILNNNIQPQILFIERCLNFLKSGGRMGIIIPETYFHGKNAQYVTKFMARHNIYCLVDLPSNTFSPHTCSKCIAAFIEKDKPQQKNILMCIAKEVGHNHEGKPIYRWDTDNQCPSSQIWDDTLTINKEVDELKKNHSGEGNWTASINHANLEGMKQVFLVESTRTENSGIYIPRYYLKNNSNDYYDNLEHEQINTISLKSLLEDRTISWFDGHASPKSEYKGNGEIPYIRVKDIVNWEIYKDPTSMIPKTVWEKHYHEDKALHEGDILFVRRGSYRIGTVAMVPDIDTQVLLTREILVLRINPENKHGIDKWYLLWLLSSQCVQKQIESKILIETTMPSIGDRWQELILPVHKNQEIVSHIANRVKDIIMSKWNAKKGIQELSNELGKLTT